MTPKDAQQEEVKEEAPKLNEAPDDDFP